MAGKQRCKNKKAPANNRGAFFVRHSHREGMARVTRLELAASGVTGRRSNQLSYTRIVCGAVYIKTSRDWQVFFGRIFQEKFSSRFCRCDAGKEAENKKAPANNRGAYFVRHSHREGMARVTRLELAASGVTGRRSNQLSYTRIVCGAVYIRGSSLWQGLFCKKETGDDFHSRASRTGLISRPLSRPKTQVIMTGAKGLVKEKRRH